MIKWSTLSQVSWSCRSARLVHDVVAFRIFRLTKCSLKLFTCTTDAGWRAHTHGVAELLQMQLRHPLSAPSTRTWETLVSRIRVMSVRCRQSLRFMISILIIEYIGVISAHATPKRHINNSSVVEVVTLAGR